MFLNTEVEIDVAFANEVKQGLFLYEVCKKPNDLNVL